MITDVRASQMFLLLHEAESVASIARRLKMSEKTVRKYRDADQLPSQIEGTERVYRTREDPLSEFWDEVTALLEQDPRLKPYAILDWLKQKYNPPEGEPRVTDSIRRTLERRVQSWKLQQGVERDVKFPQIHHPGDVIAFDFVVLNSLKVTLDGKPFDHMLFHAVFTYSNHEYAHLCHSESFEALSAGLQDALHLAGGVPRRVRSDNTQPSGFVKLPQPRDHALSRSGFGAVRFDERPIRSSRAVFVLKILPNKHDRGCYRSVFDQPDQTLSLQPDAILKHWTFQFRNSKTLTKNFAHQHFVPLLGKLG